MEEKGEDDPLTTLYGRPGFLLRRANQIASAMFLEVVAEFDITTTQYGALIVLASRGSVDQVGIARLLGLDRSTAGLVIANLEKRGALRRTSDPGDGRRRLLTLTPEGSALLSQVTVAAERVPDRELEVFSPREAREFLRLLTKFVSTYNASVRTPLLSN